MAPSACKISHGCNVLQVPIQLIPLGVPKWGSGEQMKIVRACLRTILRGEFQIVGNSPLRRANPTLNPIYLPTYLF